MECEPPMGMKPMGPTYCKDDDFFHFSPRDDGQPITDPWDERYICLDLVDFYGTVHVGRYTKHDPMGKKSPP